TGTGMCKHRLGPKGITGISVPSLHLHPTEFVVAVVSGPLLQVRDLQTGALLVTVTLPWSAAMCAWSLDGRTLAVSDFNSGLVHLRASDAAKPHLRLILLPQGHANGGMAVHFNPAGDRLVTRGWNNIVNLFDVHTGRLLFSTHSLLSTSHQRLRLDLS